MRRRAPRSLGTALRDLTRQLEPASPLARVQGVWSEVVGDVIAAHCSPVAERDGVLRVGCDEAVWAAELDLMAPEILARLERAGVGPSITALRCRADAPNVR
jgi:predicted nucleic acid-binding Zn ribbon protein